MGRVLFNLRDETGQGMVEYGLIISLVALAVVTGLLVFGPKVGNMFNNLSLHTAFNK